jgi:hypothetical protein
MRGKKIVRMSDDCESAFCAQGGMAPLREPELEGLELDAVRALDDGRIGGATVG